LQLRPKNWSLTNPLSKLNHPTISEAREDFPPVIRSEIALKMFSKCKSYAATFKGIYPMEANLKVLY
jgi:hypothetical protein